MDLVSNDELVKSLKEELTIANDKIRKLEIQLKQDIDEMAITPYYEVDLIYKYHGDQIPQLATNGYIKYAKINYRDNTISYYITTYTNESIFNGPQKGICGSIPKQIEDRIKQLIGE